MKSLGMSFKRESGVLSANCSEKFTIEQFLEFLKKNPVKVEVKSTEDIAYLGDSSIFETDEDPRCLFAPLLQVPIIWAFRSKGNTLRNNLVLTGVSDWVNISHVLDMRQPLEDTRYSIVLFVVENARPVDKKVGCPLFKEFLNSAYFTVLGSTIEALARNSNAIVPEGPLAMGVGINVGFSNNKLAQSITIRVDGKYLITFDKMK